MTTTTPPPADVERPIPTNAQIRLEQQLDARRFRSVRAGQVYVLAELHQFIPAGARVSSSLPVYGEVRIQFHDADWEQVAEFLILYSQTGRTLEHTEDTIGDDDGGKPLRRHQWSGRYAGHLVVVVLLLPVEVAGSDAEDGPA